MNAAGYSVEWLQPRDARRVAALERRLFPRDARAGLADIAEQLEVAESEGQNLCLGLHHDGRMVGYLLAFVERNRRDIPGYLEIEPPAGLALDGPGLYLADLAVLPAHRRGVALLLSRLARAVAARAELRNLPLDAYCREDQLARWTRRTRMLSRVGLRHVATHEFGCPGVTPPLFWLCFEQVPAAQLREKLVPAREAAASLGSLDRARRLEAALSSPRTVCVGGEKILVGHLESGAACDLLAPHWDRLARTTPGATLFQSSEYQRLWWSQLGVGCRPFVVVALRQGRPIAIAPLQLYVSRWLGRAWRCLSFAVHGRESDRPRLLCAAPREALVEAMLDHVFAQQDLWDALYLHEQDPAEPFYAAWRRRLRQGGHLCSETPGGISPVIDLTGGWSRYLAGRSRALRKSARRKLNALRKRGRVDVECIAEPARMAAAMHTYLAVEEASRKRHAPAGIGRSSAYRAFCLELVRRLSRRGEVQFRFLRLDGRPIAASLGVRWNGVHHALHIVHRQDHAPCSPGFVLTFLELEQLFAEGACRSCDLLGGFLTNKRGWATREIATTSLYAHAPSLHARAFHLLYFRVKPALRNALARLGLLDRVLAALRIARRRRSRANASAPGEPAALSSVPSAEPLHDEPHARG